MSETKVKSSFPRPEQQLAVARRITEEDISKYGLLSSKHIGQWGAFTKGHCAPFPTYALAVRHASSLNRTPA